MTKTKEELMAEAVALTGTGPLTLYELAEKMTDCHLHEAHEDIFCRSLKELVQEGGDASSEVAYERTASIWLGAIRQRYEEGDSLALLDAVNYCAERSIVMPEWVATEFKTRHRQITSLRAKTLDDAFGEVTPKNTQLAALRHRNQMSLLVYYGVLTKTIEEGSPMDEGLFESIGDSLGMPMSTTRRYFYWFKNSADPIITAVRPRIERSLRIWHELPKALDSLKRKHEENQSDK